MSGHVVVLAGYPGVGKSFVAREIDRAVNGEARLLSTDVIRKELFPSPTYSGDESQTVYRELFDRARSGVREGDVVVLDATFNLEIGRRSAENVADDEGADFTIVFVSCDDETARERIRERGDDSVSDADVGVYEKIKETFEPFEREFVEIDNSGTKRETRDQVRGVFWVEREW